MIIIMGSVGSGKTEQGERLAKRLGCPRLSTSQLLRENPTPKRYADMQAGKLVADRDILGLLEPAFKKIKARKNEFILDGAPRSVPQAKWLIDKIKVGEVVLSGVILLKVSDQVVADRLLLRGRPDDRKDVVLNRLDQYHAVTTPVIKYLNTQDIPVSVVNGENSPDQVEQEIVRILRLQ